MGIANATSRDADKKNEKDFYQTPSICVEALCLTFLSLYNRDIRILDPCCGKKVIGNVLRKHRFTNITEIDLYPQDDSEPVDFLSYNEKFDVIVGNPPYSLKNQFIYHGLDISKDVWYILPSQVLTYNEFHTKFLDVPYFHRKLKMNPKFFMDAKDPPKDKPFVPGGVSSYYWMNWNKLVRNSYNSSEEFYIDLRDLWKELNGIF